MSPELAQGRGIDARSDIYSLAIVLYELLTGKLPYTSKTQLDFMQKHVMEAPIPLNQRVKGRTFPEQLWAVLQKAMMKNGDDRYQSAAEFGAALSAFGKVDVGDEADRPSGWWRGPNGIPAARGTSLRRTAHPPLARFSRRQHETSSA